MRDPQQSQRIILKDQQDDFLAVWLEAFLLDRKAQGLRSGTLRFYTQKLALFSKYCDNQVITRISQITPEGIRRFLLWLEETGHNPGGVHGCYRALKAFLLWFEDETEPEGWRNPIRKVKAPRVAAEPIEPVALETIKALLATCKRGSRTGDRDRAILFTLLDTGVRAGEFLALNLKDVNLVTGEVLIRRGKGGKPRNAYLSSKTRKAIRAYLKEREGDCPSLWVTWSGEPLTYDGLRSIVRTRSIKAGVKPPKLHDFRRAFALNMLRAGVDIFALQRLMGHADIAILRRYLAQTDQDIQEAHRKGSPVERLRGY